MIEENPKGRWLPFHTKGTDMNWHMLEYHKHVHPGPFPTKYDDEGWTTLHNQLHADDKLSKPHQHFTPKKRK